MQNYKNNLIATNFIRHFTSFFENNRIKNEK